MIDNLSVDYMHCILLGVVQQFVKLWMNGSYRNKYWYISPRQVDIIDNRLSKIRPHSDIKRFPRSIKLAGQWKASELKNFLLYCSIYVLRDILTANILRHWCLLVNSTFLLLGESINAQNISESERMLDTFIADVFKICSAEHASYKVHQLSHLATCVRRCGPLWLTSCFTFESDN